MDAPCLVVKDQLLYVSQSYVYTLIQATCMTTHEPHYTEILFSVLRHNQ